MGDLQFLRNLVRRGACDLRNKNGVYGSIKIHLTRVVNKNRNYVKMKDYFCLF